MRSTCALAAAVSVGAAIAAGCAGKPAAVSADRAIVLPFIENDLPRAISQAQQARLPVFVEVWAPW